MTLRCRRRRAAGTMRCMGREMHPGAHWAWSGDLLNTWSETEASPVLANRVMRNGAA